MQCLQSPSEGTPGSPGATGTVSGRAGHGGAEGQFRDAPDGARGSSALVNGPTPLPSRQLPLLLLETLSHSDSSDA